MSKRKVGLFIAGFTTALLSAAPMAVAQTDHLRKAKPLLTPANADLIRNLCLATQRELTKLHGASVEDAEAAIVYALSQANAKRDIVEPALQCAGAGLVAANLRQALANVRQAYRMSGTAAIGRVGATGSGASMFSPPVVGIGGGSGSNYTPR